jgi:predicted dehydrogenase
MTDVRIGLIGLGAFGESHLRALRGVPGVTVTAVCSRSLDRAREIAAAWNVPHAFDDHLGLCDHPGVEAVIVATEESRHVAPTLAALEAGKHVLVEKPLATTRDDALAIRAAAATARGRLLPGHIVRFEVRYAAVRDAVAQGDLGTIAAMHATRNRPRATLDTYRRCHPALVTAIHDIDAMLWISGEKPVTVRGHHRLDDGPDGVYGVWGTLTFPSGAIATLEAAWMVPDGAGLANGDTFAVLGTLGSARIDMAAAGLQIQVSGRLQIPDAVYEPELHDVTGGALHAELAHFARLVRDPDLPPVATANDGLNAVIVAEALIQSAERNEEVAIDWPA